MIHLDPTVLQPGKARDMIPSSSLSFLLFFFYLPFQFVSLFHLVSLPLTRLSCGGWCGASQYTVRAPFSGDGDGEAQRCAWLTEMDATGLHRLQGQRDTQAGRPARRGRCCSPALLLFATAIIIRRELNCGYGGRGTGKCAEEEGLIFLTPLVLSAAHALFTAVGWEQGSQLHWYHPAAREMHLSNDAVLNWQRIWAASDSMINTRRYEAANKYVAIVFEEFDTRQ